VISGVEEFEELGDQVTDAEEHSRNYSTGTQEQHEQNKELFCSTPQSAVTVKQGSRRHGRLRARR
jgi:hypothetical protein